MTHDQTIGWLITAAAIVVIAALDRRERTMNANERQIIALTNQENANGSD